MTTQPEQETGTGEAGKATDEQSEPTVRLSMNIPKSLHRRLKVGCALQDKDMTEVVTRLLEESFPR